MACSPGPLVEAGMHLMYHHSEFRITLATKEENVVCPFVMQPSAMGQHPGVPGLHDGEA